MDLHFILLRLSKTAEALWGDIFLYFLFQAGAAFGWRLLAFFEDYLLLLWIQNAKTQWYYLKNPVKLVER